VRLFKQLGHYGQSIWLDYISRQIIYSGELKRMVEEDGLSGVTTNPTLFENAIDGSHDYDRAFERLLAIDSHIDAQTLYERLSIEDVQMAADVLRPVYDHTKGRDGFVSIEVSPYLAHDTPATIVEAQRLWNEVSRPNLMVKIPATQEGIPAIDALLARDVETVLRGIGQPDLAAKNALDGRDYLVANWTDHIRDRVMEIITRNIELNMAL